MADYVVDLQGFKKPIDEFVLKEFALVPVYDGRVQPLAFVLEPPFEWDSLPAPYKCTNSWLIRNYHGLPWESGDVPYEAGSMMIREFLKDARSIYVKGSEKKEWISKFTEESTKIINLENIGCPSLFKLRKESNASPPKYHHHSNLSKFCCVGDNARMLRNWLYQPANNAL